MSQQYPQDYDPRQRQQWERQQVPWQDEHAPPAQYPSAPADQRGPFQQPGYQPTYPPGPQPQQPRAAAPAAKRKPSALRGCLTLIGIAAVLGIVIALVTSGGNGASFKAKVGSFTVINPADLAVAVHVTNTGKKAATPTCTIQASDPSGAYTGFDEATLDNPVPAGQTVTYVDNVTISSQGASYVTSVTVSC